MVKQIIKQAGLVSTMGLAALGAAYVTAPAANADYRSDFINKVAQPVREISRQYNLYGSVMMAQATLESGWGQSALAIEANNYFGIKGTYNGQSVTMRTAEYDANGNIYYINAAFRKYPSAKESMNDNGDLIRNGLSWNHAFYSGAWRENASDYKAAAYGLQGKYATAPTYAQSLISVIESNGYSALVDGDTVTSQASMQYPATITQNGRWDGLYEDQPWNVYGNKHIGDAPSYNGRHVMITKEVQTSNGIVWVGFKLNGKMVYMDRAGISRNNFASVNVSGVVRQNGRNDVFYKEAPWNWVGAVWSTPVSKTNLVGKYVTANKSVQSDGVTWYAVNVNGEEQWVDSRAIQVDNTKPVSVNYTAKINQNGRNDALYADKPWSLGATWLQPMTKANGQSVQVTSEWTTADGIKWVGFKYNGRTVYMDARGVQKIGDVQALSGNVMLKGRSGDALYGAMPHGFFGEDWKNWLANLDGSHKMVALKAKMTGANGVVWYQIVLNGQTYWIDSAATVADNSSTRTVNYVASINQNGRNDAIYANQPWNYDGAVWLYSASRYNNKFVTVNAERTTPDGVTWIQYTDANGKQYWMDKAGVRVIGDIQSVNFTKTFNQFNRSDALYLGAPWNFANATWWQTIMQSGQNNKQIKITRQVTIEGVTWYSGVVNGKTVWFDSAAVK